MYHFVNKPFRILLCLALLFGNSALVHAGEVEVLHYWTSGGEAAAVNVLKQMTREAGDTWKEFVIPGGSGVQAREELDHRILMRKPPVASVLKGKTIKQWARFGYLANLDKIAQEENWDAKLPSVISEDMKFDGHYVATPVNVHRSNWMWVNKAILDEVGVSVPTSWAEFESAAKKIKAAGYDVIAQGNEPWQDATLFEAVTLAVGGADFYRQVFIEHNSEALRSDTMNNVFAQMKRIRPYLAHNNASESWDAATKQVINGKAAFQFMGDWAKGEFQLADKKPGVDYVCAATPGTKGNFIYIIDSFAMFDLTKADNEADNTEAQSTLASNVMSERFQVAFNKAKGSIPARTDISLDEFDLCAKKSKQDFMEAANNGTLLPSIAHGMATSEQVLDQFAPSVSNSWRDDLEPAKASSDLWKAIRYGLYIMK